MAEIHDPKLRKLLEKERAKSRVQSPARRIESPARRIEKDLAQQEGLIAQFGLSLVARSMAARVRRDLARHDFTHAREDLTELVQYIQDVRFRRAETEE